MLVYRVEMTNGDRPFGFHHFAVDDLHNELCSQNLADESTSPTRHPTPDKDEKLAPLALKKDIWDRYYMNVEYENYLFAFESIESFTVWFDSEALRKRMNEVGYVIKVFDCPDVLVGTWQVMFNPKTARLVETKNIPTLVFSS